MLAGDFAGFVRKREHPVVLVRTRLLSPVVPLSEVLSGLQPF